MERSSQMYVVVSTLFRTSISNVSITIAPSRPSKHPERRKEGGPGRRPGSPPLQPLDFGLASSSSFGAQPSTSLASSWKPPSLPSKLPTVPAPLTQIRETLPMPFVLQAPEEQTDNWDDDFEEGISLSKLHGEYLLFIFGFSHIGPSC